MQRGKEMSEQQGGAVDAPGYEIVRRIGGTEGADVHLARQQALGREVALKVLRSATQDTEQLERFAEQNGKVSGSRRHGSMCGFKQHGARWRRTVADADV